MLKAEYDAISPKDSFFVVSKGGMQSVLTENLKQILPFMEADLWISGNSITATMKDHTLRKYNLQGELIDDFLISNVDRLYCMTPMKYDILRQRTMMMRVI